MDNSTEINEWEPEVFVLKNKDVRIQRRQRRQNREGTFVYVIIYNGFIMDYHGNWRTDTDFWSDPVNASMYHYATVEDAKLAWKNAGLYAMRGL